MNLDLLIFALQDFLDKGGPVLWAILFLTLIMVGLFIERFLYLNSEAKTLQSVLLKQFEDKPDNYSRLLVNTIAYRHLFKQASLLKFTIAILPLFGLLGTVTGMIEVFEVMGYFGNGNPRLMASGVAKAIIPTMSGMAIAVIGLISYHFFISLAKKRHRQMEKQLNEVYYETL